MILYYMSGNETYDTRPMWSFKLQFSVKIRMKGVEIDIDNKWIVPYNPLLSKMFQSHINVEFCNSMKSIKYICKYVTKGSDKAMINVPDPKKYDEIEQYQMGRNIF